MAPTSERKVVVFIFHLASYNSRPGVLDLLFQLPLSINFIFDREAAAHQQISVRTYPRPMGIYNIERSVQQWCAAIYNGPGTVWLRPAAPLPLSPSVYTSQHAQLKERAGKKKKKIVPAGVMSFTVLSSFLYNAQILLLRPHQIEKEELLHHHSHHVIRKNKLIIIIKRPCDTRQCSSHNCLLTEGLFVYCRECTRALLAQSS